MNNGNSNFGGIGGVEGMAVWSLYKVSEEEIMYKPIPTDLPPLVWLVVMESPFVGKDFSFVQALCEAEALAKARLYFPYGSNFIATKTISVLS